MGEDDSGIDNEGTRTVGCLTGGMTMTEANKFASVGGGNNGIGSDGFHAVGCLTGGINMRVMGESDGGIVVVIPIVGKNTVVVVVGGDTVGCFVGRMHRAPEDVVEQSPSAVGCFVGRMRSPAVGWWSKSSDQRRTGHACMGAGGCFVAGIGSLTVIVEGGIMVGPISGVKG